jgi:prohibitin 2
MSLKPIEQEEYGVAYDIHQRKLSTQVQGVGLHSGPPGFKFLLFPKTIETVNVPIPYPITMHQPCSTHTTHDECAM